MCTRLRWNYLRGVILLVGYCTIRSWDVINTLHVLARVVRMFVMYPYIRQGVRFQKLQLYQTFAATDYH